MKKLENIEDVIDLVAVSLEKRDKFALDSLLDAIVQIANWSGDCVHGGEKAVRLIKQAYATIEQAIRLSTTNKVKKWFYYVPLGFPSIADFEARRDGKRLPFKPVDVVWFWKYVDK